MGVLWRTRGPRIVLIISLVSNVVLVMLYLNLEQHNLNRPDHPSHRQPRDSQFTDQQPTQDRPYIFVGGVPRSGTTLLRVLLDSHPTVRCGQETRLIPRILSLRNRWRKSVREKNRLQEAGLNEDVLNAVIRNFISDIIERHGEEAPRLCNKDPLSLNYMEDLITMFPKAKYLLMIRDGRAVAHSIVSSNVSISGVDSSRYLSAAKFWDRVMTKMWKSCSAQPKLCLPVHYEKLVKTPKIVMKNVLQFLGIPWHDNILKHHLLIQNLPLSRLEPSTNQVKKAINTESLYKWKQIMSQQVQHEIASSCPMLKELGYID